MSVAFQLVSHTLRRFMQNDGMARAGYMAFASLLAFFPFMIFLGALASFMGGLDAIDEVMAFAVSFLPRDVAETLEPLIGELLERRRGGMLTVGLVGTMWAASVELEAFRYALNRAGSVPEGVADHLPIWQRQLKGMFLILLGVSAFLLAVLAVVIGPMIWKLAAPVLDIALTWKWLWDGARYLLAVFVLLAVVTVLYHWLPDTRPRWRHILPGALLASFGWLLLASLFSIFLDRAEIFTVFYGGLGSIIVTLLFLLFSAADFILGAEFNAVLRERRAGA